VGFKQSTGKRKNIYGGGGDGLELCEFETLT